MDEEKGTPEEAQDRDGDRHRNEVEVEAEDQGEGSAGGEGKEVRPSGARREHRAKGTGVRFRFCVEGGKWRWMDGFGKKSDWLIGERSVRSPFLSRFRVDDTRNGSRSN